MRIFLVFKGGRLSLYTYTVCFEFLHILFFLFIQGFYVIYTHVCFVSSFSSSDYLVLVFPLACSSIILMAQLGGKI